jgi:hypothetical protein
MMLQWRKSVSLEATLKLLEDIQQVASAPAKIDKALAHKVTTEPYPEQNT